MKRPLALLGALLLGACNDGTLTLSVADAPVDEATRVRIRFTGLELTHSNGDREDFNFSPARDLDLTSLDRGRSAVLLSEVRIPEGDYQSVRLKIDAGSNADDSFLDRSGGERCALPLPSANESLLTLAQTFTIEERESLELTVDFDLRKSIVNRPNPANCDEAYELKPSLRLLKDDRVGFIAGSVAALLRPSGCVAAVYVYDGAVAEPGDVGSPTSPLASSLIAQTISGGLDYRVAWLNPGDYTVAYTCDADLDDPELDDAVVFSHRGEVSVSERATATFNFQ